MPSRRRPLVALALVLGVVAGGCASTGPSPTPLPLPASFAWSRASIELPPDVVEIAPGSTAGAQCSPCHAVQASLMTAVAATPEGLLAVGQQLPPSTAVAYRSPDGRHWTPEPAFEPGDDTAALGVAADGDRRLIVGRRGPAGAAWLSVADGTWQASPSPELGAPAGGTAELRAAVPWGGGWVAVGSVDADAAHRTAAIWRSADGLAWERVTGGPGFLGSAAYGVAAAGDRLVVVGSGAGGETSATPAPGVAWISDDGSSWTLVESPSFAAGPLRAVTATPTGFVAVGFGIDDARAAAWTSPDGAAWTPVPDQPAFVALDKPIRMGAVAWGGDGLVAAGWKSDAGNGTGVVWRSADGATWERVEDQVSMSGASLTGVAFAGDEPVVVGTSGYPDNDQAAAWYEGPEAD
jgi:hypothetical protein